MFKSHVFSLRELQTNDQQNKQPEGRNCGVVISHTTVEDDRYGAPEITIDELQTAQNNAARVIVAANNCRSDAKPLQAALAASASTHSTHHRHILFTKKGGGLPEKPKLIIRWSPII